MDVNPDNLMATRDFAILPKKERSEAQRRASLNNLVNAKFGRKTGDEWKRAGGLNAQLEDALVGDLDPVRKIRRETPAHRTMVNMAMAGYQNTEIAAFCGVSLNTVATVLRQPENRQRLIQQTKKLVQDEIKELLEKQAIPSIQALMRVRDDSLSPAPAVVSASNSLLDRFLGKPVQPINENIKPPCELTDEELRQQVEAELKAAVKTN